MRFGAAIILVALMLAGCSDGPALTPGPQLTVAPTNELPPPTTEDLTKPVRAYRIGGLDKLSITVFGVPDLSIKVQADASGQVSMPLIGAIQASGKTPDELARAIEDGLRRKYVRDPQVTVNLEETISQVITVDGEVKKPGLYPVVGRLTLIRAVATAEGLTEFARTKDVVIFRTVGDKQMAGLYNIDGIRRGYYPDPEVYAGDVISVGDSRGRRLFRDVLQAVPLLTPIIYAIR